MKYVLRWFAAVIASCAISGSLPAGQAPPKPKPKPSPVDKPAKPSPPPSKVSTTTLVITTDLACSVSIDGEVVGTLDANATRRFHVKPGEHIVSAVALEGGAKWQGTARARLDEQSALLVTLQRAAPPEPPKPAQPSGSILVSVDAASRVHVDGKEVGVFAANDARSIPVGAGEHLVRATSQEEDVSTQETVKVSMGQTLVNLNLLGPVQEARRLRQPPAVAGRWRGEFTDQGDTWQFQIIVQEGGQSGSATWRRLIPHLDETWYGRGTVTISYEPGRRVRMSIVGKEETKRSAFEKNWLITGTVATDDSTIDAAAKSLINWGEGRMQLRRF